MQLHIRLKNHWRCTCKRKHLFQQLKQVSNALLHNTSKRMQRLPEGKVLPSFSETTSGFFAFSPVKHTQCFLIAFADSLSSAERLEKHSLNFCRILGSRKCTCHAGSLIPYVTLPLSEVPVNADTAASPAPRSLLSSYQQIYEIQTLLSQGREG